MVRKAVDEIFNSNKEGIDAKIYHTVTRVLRYESDLRRTICDVIKQNIVDVVEDLDIQADLY